MRRLVFDIETARYPFEDLTESQQEYLLRPAQKEDDDEKRAAMEEELKRFTSLYPFTAKLLAIGFLDVEKEKTYVYYHSDEPEEEWTADSNGAVCKGLPERDLIESFWRVLGAVDQAISFNGRGFDAPFLHLRSAMLRVKPTRQLMGYRYRTDDHLDLLEMFSYYGAFRRFNLDFYCRAFGVESPKSHGVTGMDVPDLYEKGDMRTIAEYCADDVIATTALYNIWNEYLNIGGRM
jgi:hypothetical protein